MSSNASVPDSVVPLRCGLRDAIESRYEQTDAKLYGITRDRFHEIVVAVLVKYGSGGSDDDLELLESLRLRELLLARACVAGNEGAWNEFLRLHRIEMHRAAHVIAGDEATGRELADGLWAELYGLPNREGRRVSKLDYYMGRGSLQGWLRTVLVQEHVNRFRSRAADVSLDEQAENGASFVAPAALPDAQPDSRLAEAIHDSLAELGNEERFLLASYYLDGRTLAAIGRQLGVHESTISRKLDKTTAMLRKRIRRRLQASGMDARQCDEMLHELDVRDLNVNVAETLQQERPMGTF
jgi:RNA polymerase sigma-70 factor (ECF subfamily)